jgi:two-component system phosphate regulon sensor histidine kinase PhoR
LERASKDLPEVLIDREAIAQAFMNLLDNAAKYSGRGKRIVVKVWQETDSVIVSVQDEGIGISPEDQKMIFEKFYRVATDLVHDVKGSGLGLAIVEHIVRAHGGRVSVDSTPGSGSIFVIQLPKTNLNQHQDQEV